MDVKAHFDKKIGQYEEKLAQHKENMRQWKECKAKGIDPAECLKELGLSAEMLRRPSKPTGKSHAKKGCAGNYKTPSKHSSVRYLKHFFRQLRPDVKKFIPDNSGVFAMLKSKKKVGPRGSLGNFVPRVREAMEIVGVAETAKIANDAVASGIAKALEQVKVLEKKLAKSDERMGKTEANQAKKLEAVRKRLEARKEKLAKERDTLQSYIAAVQARRARARKGRRLLRRK